jgi:general secretion pathway protein M
MNDNSLPTRRALLAAASYGAAFAFAVALGVWFYAENNRLGAEFEVKSQLLERLRGPAISGRTETSQLLANTPTFMIASTETVAASDLQKQLLEFAATREATVHSIQARVDTEVNGEGLRRISVELVFDSKIEALQSLLFDIETAVPFIFVNTLAVQSSAVPAAKAEETLRVTLTTSSYSKNAVTAKATQ